MFRLFNILVVSNKALEGLDMVNPRLSNSGGMRSGDYNTLFLPPAPVGLQTTIET